MPSGQTYADAFGRFRLNPPQGTVPVAAIYNFMNPAAMTQIAIQAMAHDQMFQNNLQQFPGMMRQMGGKVDTEQPLNVRGKQARLIAVTMRDQSGALNAFHECVHLRGQRVDPGDGSGAEHAATSADAPGDPERAAVLTVKRLHAAGRRAGCG